jgi:NADH-quinone oxidoreductase subunit F
MARLASVAELESLRGRIVDGDEPRRPCVVVSAGTCGQASGANRVIRHAKRELLEGGLCERVGLRITGCLGFCQVEPIVVTHPDGTFYPNVEPGDVGRIIDACLAGECVEDLLYRDPATGRAIRRMADVPFYARQTRLLLADNEHIDPIRIHDYLRTGGYGALGRALERADPGSVIGQMERSGLRERAGAGHRVGAAFADLRRRADGAGALLVCSADESDPGSHLARALLEGNPHAIIEAMIVGAYAVGADRGVVVVPSEAPLAVKHLVVALGQARDLGLLGPRILGSALAFDISVASGRQVAPLGGGREPTGCAPDTSRRPGRDDGGRPEPSVLGKPASIECVETWANVAKVLAVGAAAFASIGLSTDPGTKLVALAGAVRCAGLIEVPTGETLDQIVAGIGGGPAPGRSVKAVRVGGPSGACFPADRLDARLDRDELRRGGCEMGAGGLLVVGDDACMVDLARYDLAFLAREGCGVCEACVGGVATMRAIVSDVAEGRASSEDLDRLERIATGLGRCSGCEVGRHAGAPVLATLGHFRHELVEHVQGRRCDAHVCDALGGSPCHAACPIGVEPWRIAAHLGRGQFDDAYEQLREANPLPGVCARVCHRPCEAKCRAETAEEPGVAIRALERFVADRARERGVLRGSRAGASGGRAVAIVGAGPCGLVAAHDLSRLGCRVTVFETADRPGGMLQAGIPSYRLPREVLHEEIAALLGAEISLRCGVTLGRDITVDGLLAEGFGAVLLALGAHRSRRLGLEGEDAQGVFPSMRFLKTFSQVGKSLAKGRVGVVGAGHAAVASARVALRQPGVATVTLFDRRPLHEWPALPEDLREAQEEGIALEPLVRPVRIHARAGSVQGVAFVRVEAGRPDASGRRAFVPVTGTDRLVPLETLVVATGEQTFPFSLDGSEGLELEAGRLPANPDTLETARPGVFAGGDAVTGPGTVVDAMAAGRRAALMVDRWLRGEPLRAPRASVRRSEAAPAPPPAAREAGAAGRLEPERASLDARRDSFVEIETSVRESDARSEAGRCLRCDRATAGREELAGGAAAG